MKLQVKYEELYSLGTEIEKKKEEIDGILNNIDKLIDDVASGWSGKDSETFISNTKEKIANEKDRNKKIKLVSDSLKYAAKNYKTDDEDALNYFKKGDVNNE